MFINYRTAEYVAKVSAVLKALKSEGYQGEEMTGKEFDAMFTRKSGEKKICSVKWLVNHGLRDEHVATVHWGGTVPFAKVARKEEIIIKNPKRTENKIYCVATGEIIDSVDPWYFETVSWVRPFVEKFCGKCEIMEVPAEIKAFRNYYVFDVEQMEKFLDIYKEAAHEYYIHKATKAEKEYNRCFRMACACA